MVLFRKRVSAEEFGGAVLYLAHDWLVSDATRALGSCLDGWYHVPPNGQIAFFESKGVTKVQLRSYLRFVDHCSLHAVALAYEPNTRKEILRGAMSGFPEPASGYDLDRVYLLLEDFYLGSKRFDTDIEILKSTAPLAHFLPARFQSAGIVNARFLLAECVTPMKIAQEVIQRFEFFSSTINATVATAQRAANHVLQDVKFA